jgi:predicted N-acetyltransferase YhbS
MATEIRGLREDELAAHAELVHQSYYEYVVSGERTFLADPLWWLKSAQGDPYYDPDQSRVMFIDGRQVASVTNYDRWVHGAGKQARVSCLGSVCTHPDFRRRGLIREVLAESIAWMARSGFHWSHLFGAEGVYGSSGWTALGSFTVTADLRVREEFGREVACRAVDPERDATTLVAMYERFCGGLAGPVVRSEAYWRQRVLGGRWGPPSLYMLECDGRPVGYFGGEDGRLRELAWVDRPHDVLAFLLRRWEGQPVSFPCATLELVRLLREVSYAPSAGAIKGGINLQESYKGLWRFIAPHQDFPEITDTESLKRFLRDHEYIFWPEDGF